MSLIIFFICVLLIMLTICMLECKHFLLTPQFGILTSFILALLGCLANVEKWGLHFSKLTVVVIVTGLGVISIVSLLFQHLFKINKKLNEAVAYKTDNEIVIHKNRIVIWTGVNIINLFSVFQFLMHQSHSNLLSIAINTYRTSIYSDQEVVLLPFFTRITRSFCIYSGYLFLYLLIYNIVNKKKSTLNKYYVINIVCSIISCMVVGGNRGSLLQYIVTGVTIYFALFTFKYHRAFSAKLIIYVLIILILFVLGFGKMSEWLGRGEVDDLTNTIYAYLSGGIANLDTYLSNADYYSSDKNYTFNELINAYYGITGQQDLQYRTFLSDVYIVRKGVVIGNVYTMFANYYNDGKLLGVIIYSAFMAFIGQWILSLAISKFKNDDVDVSLIVYGYLFFDFFQCNFSNRLYAQLFSINMIKFIISLIILKIFFTTDMLCINLKGHHLRRNMNG